MMERDLQLPINLHLGRPEDEASQHVSRYAEELQAKLEWVYKFAQLYLKLRSNQMKDRLASSPGHSHLFNVKKEGVAWGQG